MALIDVDRAVVNLGGVTRKSLLEHFGLKTGLLQTGTCTGGAINAIIDTGQLQSTQLSPSEWTGGWVRISSSTDNADPEGDIRTISEFQPELGKCLANPNFTAAPAFGDTYELWKINPKVALDIIDRALENDLYGPCWTVLSEIDDYDMEASNTNSWTASNATLSKLTTGVRAAQQGKRWLQVTNTAAGGYAACLTLNVAPLKAYHASALVRCQVAGTTAKLQVWDVTNSREIISYTTNSRTTVRIAFNWNCSADCFQVTYRLIGVESTATNNWDEVCAYQVSSTDISLPWWVKKLGQVKGIFQHQHLGTLNQQIWDPGLRGEVDTRWDVRRNYGSGNQFRVFARQGYMSSWPLFLYGLRNETAYSDDTLDKKYIDIPKFVACVAYKLYERASQPLVTGILDSKNFKEMLGPIHAEWMLLAQEEAEGLEDIIHSDTPWRKFSNTRFSYGNY